MNVPKPLGEAELEAVIPAFYARVRADDLIGPVFNAAISEWDFHLGKLVAFWSSVMLTSGRYKGNPVAAHARHVDTLTPEMFDRWLALWADVTSEMLPDNAASALQNKAARIAESLKLALWFRLPSGDAPQADKTCHQLTGKHADPGARTPYPPHAARCFSRSDHYASF